MVQEALGIFAAGESPADGGTSLTAAGNYFFTDLLGFL